MLFNTMGRFITALETQKRNSARVNVHLDGVYAFSLARIVAAWLTVGRELSDEEIEALRREDSFEEAARVAMRFIAYKPRTITELRKRLIDGKLPEQVVEHTISRFTATGLINDGQYARDWVNNRQVLHPRSTRMIDYELRRKGVAEADIEAALADVSDDDQMAYQLANQKIDRYAKLDLPEFRSKLGGYLARRGFSYEVIARVVNRLWSERIK
ncbi:MAG: RecX family transcriptional regulator [Anaerolineaceae bacterium]